METKYFKGEDGTLLKASSDISNAYIESPRSWDNLGTCYFIGSKNKYGDQDMGDKHFSDKWDLIEQMGRNFLVSRDQYNQTRGGLIYNKEEKTFALWQGQGLSVYSGDENVKKTSWKNVIEKAKELKSLGFTEEKCRNYKVAGLKLSSLEKPKKSRDDDFGRR